MSLNLSSWSIKSPVPTIVLFLILGVVGLMSFFQLGINDNPNIDIPAVSVTVTQSGAGPEELESQVTKKIEDAVAGIGNIDELKSVVTEGQSQTTISFVLGRIAIAPRTMSATPLPRFGKTYLQILTNPLSSAWSLPGVRS
jgi:multidrug efflux pump subunit AcrB